MQVFSYEQPVPDPDPEFSLLEPGFEWAVIDVEACAGPTEDDTGLRFVNPFDFELQMPDNTRLMSDIPVKEPALNDVALPGAGECARGFVTYQVPEGQRPVAVVDTAVTADDGFTPRPVRWMVPG